MLLKLSIENYALIHKLEIDFTSGLSVITGETGAGKSILLGALSLILGQRTDATILLDKNKKCRVEGTFAIKGYNLEELFHTNELDFDVTTILRREIGPGGKSRAFINDSPVSLTQLKDFGDRLVNIHSQYTTRTLNDADFQLSVLDSYSNSNTIVSDYRSGYVKLISLKKQLNQLINIDNKAKGDYDYYTFLYKELFDADLKDGEQEEIENRLRILLHAEEIKSKLFIALEVLSNNENSVLSQLTAVTTSLSEVTKYFEQILPLLERLKSNYIDIKDVSEEIENLNEQVFVDSREMEMLNQRLDLIYRLQKKHQVSKINELIELRYNIENKLHSAVDLGEKIKLLQKEIEEIQNGLKKLAKDISNSRIKSFSSFEKEMTQLLSSLGMPHAEFKIEQTYLEDMSFDGIDMIRFLFSANKGISLNEVSKIASGGEQSRLMLSIKSMIFQKNLLPTIVFDEIDSGVSGEIAGKVGDILLQMSKNMQVIVITHLPQIAGKGDQHYWVFKSVEKGISRTGIKNLNRKERVEEIAKMLSDKSITAAGYQAASELLNN